MRRHTNREEIWGFELKLARKSENSKVLLGLDGGTTSTVCVCTPAPSSHEQLSDPLPILARVVGGCSNHNSIGETAARQEMEEVMAEALKMAGFSRLAVRVVCLAVSGVNHVSDQHRVIQWLRQIFPDNVQLFVHNDAVAALASGTAGKLHGCVLIAGTGSIAYGFTEDGREARAAGAGPVLGDWGRWTYADPSWARIAAIVPVVMACAAAGDKVAENVLLNAIRELAESVKAVVQRLKLCGEDGRDSFPLVMVGGVLETDNGWDMGKEVVRCISNEFQGVIPIQPKVEPAVGAAMLAWNYCLKASLERIMPNHK